MLSQTDVNFLRLMSLGFGTREIAATVGLDFKEFISLYSNLLLKTNCWDEVDLGSWWAKNQHEYAYMLPDTLVSFDFTKFNN